MPPEPPSEQVPVRVLPGKSAWSWAVECDRHGIVLSGVVTQSMAEQFAESHKHCTCPEVGGCEVGDYIVDLCHTRDIHDEEVIWPLVNAAREDALALCEQVVNEALGPVGNDQPSSGSH
jgi:hypothetical protein